VYKQVSNTAGADGAEQHAAPEVPSDQVDPWPLGDRAKEGKTIGGAGPEASYVIDYLGLGK
jgi:hypothetical protein